MQAGQDEVPAMLLKKCAPGLGTPLCMLWTASMETVRVLSEMKKSLITPVHKGGGKGLASIYGPVTLISHVTEIFEKIVVKEIVEYMSANALYSEGQHIVRGGRSYVSQLLAPVGEVVGFGHC